MNVAIKYSWTYFFYLSQRDLRTILGISGRLSFGGNPDPGRKAKQGPHRTVLQRFACICNLYIHRYIRNICKYNLNISIRPYCQMHDYRTLSIQCSNYITIQGLNNTPIRCPHTSVISSPRNTSIQCLYTVALPCSAHIILTYSIHI